MKSIIQIADRQPAPPLLPILRSQQQGEILALLLGSTRKLGNTRLVRANTASPYYAG